MDPPATSLAAQGKSAEDRPDVDEANPRYSDPAYAAGGFYGIHAAAKANAAMAHRAAELAAERLKWAEARRVQIHARLSKISSWVFELRDRAMRENTDRYASTIEYLIGQSDELKAEFEHVKAMRPRARADIERHLDAFEEWSRQAGVREPRIERERAYASYSAMEILGRGLVDTVTGMTGLDALIPPMLPDGSGQAGGFLAGLLLAPLVGGLKAAAQVGSVTVDTMKALVRVKKAADAVELAQKARGGLRLVEATVELKKATEAMKVIGKGAKAGATAGQAVRAAEAANARRAAELGGRLTASGGGTGRLSGRAGVTAGGEGSGAVESVVARRAAGSGKPLPTPDVPWRYAKPGELGPRDFGGTYPHGEIIIRPGLSPTEFAETLRHEAAHRFLIPRGEGGVTSFRQRARVLFYKNSVAMRLLEEGVAETYGTRSLLRGAGRALGGAYSRAPGWGDLALGAGVGGVVYVSTKKPGGSR